MSYEFDLDYVDEEDEHITPWDYDEIMRESDKKFKSFG